MKATSDRLPLGPGWAYEIKWDGMRALTTVEPDGQVSAYSSRGNRITTRFPELRDLANATGGLAVALDGEIVALDDRGLPSFSRLQGRMHLDRANDIARQRLEIPVIYVVFDLLHLDGVDTVGLGYDQRRQLLETLVEPGPPWQLGASTTTAVPNCWLRSPSVAWKASWPNGAHRPTKPANAATIG